MRNIFTLTLLSLALFSTATLASDKLTGSEILAVQKGGIADKVYRQAQPQLRVATYNIGKNEAADNVADFTALNTAIKTIAAEIIAVPEVDNKTARSQQIDQLKTIAEANNYHYAFGKAIDFDGGEYGLGILSKYPIVKSQVIPLPSGDAEQRIALIAQITVPGFDSPVLFIATHFDWQKDPSLRIEQARKILDVSIGDAKSDFKDIASSIKILAGDFNSTSEEQPMKEIGYFFTPVKQANTDYRTWPAVNPALDIDHLFTFKGQQWQVKKLEIPHDSPTFAWSSASDHLPLIADLVLTEQ